MFRLSIFSGIIAFFLACSSSFEFDVNQAPSCASQSKPSNCSNENLSGSQAKNSDSQQHADDDLSNTDEDRGQDNPEGIPSPSNSSKPTNSPIPSPSSSPSPTPTSSPSPSASPTPSPTPGSAFEVTVLQPMGPGMMTISQGTPVTIDWSVSTPIGYTPQTETVEIYGHPAGVTPNCNDPGGILIAELPDTQSSTYIWNTSSTPQGIYDICVVFSDTYNTVFQSGEGWASGTVEIQ